MKLQQFDKDWYRIWPISEQELQALINYYNLTGIQWHIAGTSEKYYIVRNARNSFFWVHISIIEVTKDFIKLMEQINASD